MTYVKGNSCATWHYILIRRDRDAFGLAAIYSSRSAEKLFVRRLQKSKLIHEKNG